MSSVVLGAVGPAKANASRRCAVAGVVVKLGKFDLSTYFRIFGKQRAHVHQSGRLYESLFGFDRRVNFGERDAPDHTGRASDALAFFVRRELKRLGREYAPKCASIVAWVAMRMGHAAAAGDTDDADGIWFALFFFLYYVDDAGLAAFDDALCRSSGEPVIIQVVDGAGVVTKRQQHRAELYFEAAMQIVRRYGHDTPVKKQSRMALTLEFLGVWLDSSVMRRLLTRDKRRAYWRWLRSWRVRCAPIATPLGRRGDADGTCVGAVEEGKGTNKKPTAVR